MESLPQAPQLPQEILRYIFSMTDQEIKDLAPVSKNWNAAVKRSLAALFESYNQNNSLHPYAELAEQVVSTTGSEQDQNIQKVRFVFQEVVKKAQQIGYQKESLTIQNLSAAHLEEITDWIKEKEALNLGQFVSKIPEMKPFLNTIKDLPLLDKAQAIITWMGDKDNAPTLQGITTLNLKSSNLTILPKEIKYLTGLQGITFQDNQLTFLPSEIGVLTNLESLVLTNNKLTILPTEIGLLSNLQRLYLVSNQLQSIPLEIAYLSDLETLNLSNNQLTTVPLGLSGLTKLKSVNLSNNKKITAFPNQIGQLIHQGNGRYESQQ